MRGDVNKSSLERGYLDAFMRASTEVHAPQKGANDAEPKASAVVQAPGNGSQEEILEASREILGDIYGNEVVKAHSYGYSTNSVRLSDPLNDGLLRGKLQESGTEDTEAPLLDSNSPVTGVDKGQHRK